MLNPSILKKEENIANDGNYDETASADHLFWIIPVYKGIIFIGSSLVWIIPSPSPFTYDHVYVYIYMICVYMYILDHPEMIHSPPQSQTVYIERLDHPGMIHSTPQKSNCIYRENI